MIATTRPIGPARPRAAALALLAAIAAGCGGGTGFPSAAVSGRVTLDGKPLADAIVRFTPTADPAAKGKAAHESGPDSAGITDADGRFTLSIGDGSRGATVGPNRVTITTVDLDESAPDYTTEGLPVKPTSKEAVPARYNAQTELTFDVPPEGTDKADFPLTSP